MNLFLILAFLFFIGSLSGWGLEVLFRRFISKNNPERKWINPGFCAGPYLPIYGFGLCIMYLIASVEKFNIVTSPNWEKVILFLTMAVCMTAIEYIAGVLVLKMIKVRLWDYSSEKWNIQGIICPKFSVIWALLGAMYMDMSNFVERRVHMKKEMAIGCGIGCGTSLLLVIVVVVSFMMWFSNMIDDSLSKKEIFKLVKDNYTIILDDIEEKDFSDTKKLKGVQEVYSDTEIVDVYCGGSGFGSATSYYGFYYTEDDLPKAIWCGTKYCDESLLVEDGDGYSTDFQHNYYYTEKIMDNFYYYEAHF